MLKILDSMIFTGFGVSDFDMQGNPALHVQYFTVFNGGIGFDAPWQVEILEVMPI